MALELITKRDNFEIIADQIAQILTNEIANQIQLATASTDPNVNADDYRLRIYREHFTPWEVVLNSQSAESRQPLVNIWFDSSSFDKTSSNISQQQKCTATYNIDCYGLGLSQDVATGGHVDGDEDAARQVHRAIRLVRNILMAAENTYLGMRGTVWHRWPQSITPFQPQIDGQQVQKVMGSRIAFSVEFNEFSPQVVPETIEEIGVDLQRASDGSIIAECDYNFVTP